MLKIILLKIVLMIVAITAHAEIYKWKDESGKTHYGDKPAASSEKMDIKEEAKKGTSIDNASREERRKRLIETFDVERKEKKKENAKRKKEKEKLNAQCGRAKDKLRRYKRSSSLYSVDKEGNRNYLSEDTHRQAINTLQKQIKKHCK